MSDNEGGKKNEGGTKGILRHPVFSGLVGALIAAAIAAAVALAIFYLGNNPPEDDSEGIGTPETTPAQTTQPAVDASTMPSDPLDSPVLTSFSVRSAVASPTYGEMIGPARYKFVGGFGKIQVAYGWSGILSNGTELADGVCQIVVSVSGPEFVPNETSGECSNNSAKP